MRYNLGYMDKYPIEAAGSNIENTPMFRIRFKRRIDPILLESAFRKAMSLFPLFGTCVRFDKEYYLETNKRPLKLINSRESERPHNFGKNTNGYPWQCCYYDDTLTFEWLHGVSDGVGALNFLKHMLLYYFNLEPDKPVKSFLVGPGLEPFFDNKEKGINFKAQPAGFSVKDFPAISRGYYTDAHLLTADTKELITCARENKSSIASILAVLYSRAIRMHLPKGIKNSNVACNVVLDLRRPLNYETMHNCVEYKRITYLEDYDRMSFKSVAQIYKDILDKARLVPNVVRIVTERVNTFRAYHIIGNRKFLKFCVKMIGLILKDRDCNFVVTYPGKVDFPAELIEKIDNVDFKVWHDFGETLLACVDYNGQFNLNICENYVEKGIVEDFIVISRKLGIHWHEIESSEFQQAHFEEEDFE